MLNRLTLIGNLTRDPELRTTPSGHSVCRIRLAVDRMGGKDPATGEWKPGFVDVDEWGNAGEATARTLKEGALVAFDGRLTFDQWQVEGGGTRSVLKATGHVQWLPSRSSAEDSDAPAAAGAGDARSDEDIPF